MASTHSVVAEVWCGNFCRTANRTHLALQKTGLGLGLGLGLDAVHKKEKRGILAVASLCEMLPFNKALIHDLAHNIMLRYALYIKE